MIFCLFLDDFIFPIFKLVVNWWFGARWFGFLGFPYEWDSYLGPNRVQVVLYPTRSMELVYLRA